MNTESNCTCKFFSPGLFDDDEDEHVTDKREILRLMKHLKTIHLALGRFTDGKPDRKLFQLYFNSELIRSLNYIFVDCFPLIKK